MVLPSWVRDLDEYAEWLRHIVGASGGWLASGHLLRQWPVARGVGLLSLPKQELWFRAEDEGPSDEAPIGASTNFFLDFDLAVNEDLEQRTYSYHFQREDGLFIWRYCKRRGHAAGLVHAHFPPDEDMAQPAEQINLGDAVRMVREHLGWPI